MHKLRPNHPAAIAAQKAGVIKPNGVVITAAPAIARRVIAATAERQGATLSRVESIALPTCRIGAFDHPLINHP